MDEEEEYELYPGFRYRYGGASWWPLMCFEPVHDMAREFDERELDDAIPLSQKIDTPRQRKACAKLNEAVK